MLRRLERAGFDIERTHGGYRGQVWAEDAETWIVLARKPA